MASRTYSKRVSLTNLHRLLFKLGLIAVLAAVLCQATPSAPVPVSRDRGSAFDATTFEVAVLTQRDGETREAAAEVEPAIPVVALIDMRSIPTTTVKGNDYPPRQTGPPVKSVWRPLPPTRGPPIRT